MTTGRRQRPGGLVGRLSSTPLFHRLRRGLGPDTTAFVLSGGGSLGAVQVGMLRALVEAGIRPDLVIGASVGAINGAGFATDPSMRGVARIERIWRRLALGDPELMPSGLMPLAVQLARKGNSLHDPGRLQLLLEEELPVTLFSQMRVPFQCVATDLELASECWFADGPVIPALMASASLPAVFPSVEISGRAYIDGGVLNEVHTARAVELGATRIYVLHVGHLTERLVDVQRPFDGAMRAYWTARRYRLADDLRRVPSHCEVHVLPAGDTPRLRFDDFSRGPEMADIAYRQSRQYLLAVSGEADPWAGAASDHGRDRSASAASGEPPLAVWPDSGGSARSSDDRSDTRSGVDTDGGDGAGTDTETAVNTSTETDRSTSTEQWPDGQWPVQAGDSAPTTAAGPESRPRSRGRGSGGSAANDDGSGDDGTAQPARRFKGSGGRAKRT